MLIGGHLWFARHGLFVDVKDKSAGITVEDTLGCSGEQIIAEAGLGRGHTRFGITKSALLDWIEANTPSTELLAVAWSEVDGEPGFTAGDELIAQLEDTDGDGVPSEGDIVRTDVFPLDIAPSGFGEFLVKEHVVGNTSGSTYTSSQLELASTDLLGNTTIFVWGGSEDEERYVETSYLGFSSGFRDNKVDRGLVVVDAVLADPSSPSEPTPSSLSTVVRDGDDEFLNVAITPPSDP